MGRSLHTVLIISLVILTSGIASHSAAIYLKQFDFNDEQALDKWGRMVLNGHVEYKLIRYAGNGYVEALSDRTCSALYYRIGFNLRNYPILRWKWRVLKFPDKAAAATAKERDDYAARVYVIFPFLNFSTSKFIEYVWSEDLPVGTVMDSPGYNNVKLIVVRSGRPQTDEWVSESRNVYEDYINTFGRKPNLGVGAVAIMCDADGTQTTAEAMFDDIMIAQAEKPETEAQ
jgi:hypothetical protein